MVASREPLWTTVTRDNERFRVYFFNDSFGIYALGYPAISGVGHLINLGELVFLAGVLYLILLAGTSLYRALTAQTPRSGRALLREARTQFLSEAVCRLRRVGRGAGRGPGIRDADLPRQSVPCRRRRLRRQDRHRGAAAGRRLCRLATARSELASGRRRSVHGPGAVGDRSGRATCSIGRGSRRPASATCLRPTCCRRVRPSNVYRRIVLDRLPTTVTIEDVAGRPYLLAAAPVRTGGREGIVTVPQPLRGQEIERQRDELDRRVLSVSVLFVLLGAGFGYWIAERIADPVNRLTRATRRIARGDLDARIATSSSDELRGLVEDFNQMADDLKRQRADLERTQRLEAWADMARQVAHDIKNPLTPIQLSAEHARRVNLDRGAPLSPVLDDCVNAILSQVRLLRQISAEFSSFASSPTPRPEPTNLPELIEEVVEPYRTGLERTDCHRRRDGRDLPAVVDRQNAVCARADQRHRKRAARHARRRHADHRRRRHEVADGTRWSVVQVRDTGVGMDEEALREDLRAVLLDEGDGHRSGADDRQAERRIERRDDRRRAASVVSGRR